MIYYKPDLDLVMHLHCDILYEVFRREIVANLLHIESTLTDRYQIIIPDTVQPDGHVFLSKMEENQDAYYR